MRSSLGCGDSGPGLADCAHSLSTNLAESTEQLGWLVCPVTHILRGMKLSELTAGTEDRFLKSPESWARAGEDEPKEGVRRDLKEA